MLSISSDFTSLERAVLNAICEIHRVDRLALEVQLSTATFLGRENTGAGFYTYFTVERNSKGLINGERLRGGPEAEIDGLQHGMGFILWLKEGYVDCLEGYSYGESTSGVVLEKVGFKILKA